VPSTTSQATSGVAQIDAVMSGIKWATTGLTFSFPTDPAQYGTYSTGEQNNAFEAFNETQIAAVRAALKLYASVSLLTFTEVAGGAGDLRYAESDAPSTAWAYYPSSSATGGDSWFNNTKNWYDNPIKGNYAWLTVLHETGHALGLKHPHEARGAFPVMPTAYDSLEYSVMSYHSYVGSSLGGYTNGSGSYPQSLMMLDIAAIQKMYGANYATNAGDTIYRWSNTTGEMSVDGVLQGQPLSNKVFLTVWDGGGKDTYDLSNYTNNLTIDLHAGAWSTFSANQLANLGGTNLAAGNVANALLFNDNPASLIEAVIGGTGADNITGNAADNWFKGNGGADILDGDGGTNTAAYSGASGSYAWAQNADGSWTVTDLRVGAPDGVDTLKNIHFLEFSDQILAIGVPPPPPPPPPPPNNTAPVALADSYKVVSGQTLSVGGKGVLTNDTDADGDVLSALLVSTTANGTLTLNANGSLLYTPRAGFTGTDTFTYRASDGEATSSAVTVSIKVDPAKKGGPKRGQGEEQDQIPGPDNGPGHSGPHGFIPDLMTDRLHHMVGQDWWG